MIILSIFDKPHIHKNTMKFCITQGIPSLIFAVPCPPSPSPIQFSEPSSLEKKCRNTFISGHISCHSQLLNIHNVWTYLSFVSNPFANSNFLSKREMYEKVIEEKKTISLRIKKNASISPPSYFHNHPLILHLPNLSNSWED